MYKKTLIICLLALTFGTYGFSPGCGSFPDLNSFVDQIGYEVYSTATSATIEYRDAFGIRRSTDVSTFPWEYKFKAPSDTVLYLHVFNFDYSDNSCETEAFIYKNNQVISEKFCHDNNECNILLN